MQNVGHETQSRIIELDALKGLAIFLVVLGHAIIVFPVNLHNNLYCRALFDWLSGVHMPLFFIVSGFCFSCHDYKTYLLKKIRRLLIPYLIFNLLDALPRQLLGALVNRPRGLGESMLKILLYGGEYWFLYTLFMIFLIYPLLLRFLGDSRQKMIALTALSLFLKVVNVPISAFQLDSVAGYMFFFSLGVYLKKYHKGKVFRKTSSTGTSLLVLLGAAASWILLLNSGAPQILIPLIGIFTCYCLTKFDVFNKFFGRFGEYSLQLYLLNGFLLVPSRTMICGVMHVTNPLIIISFNMLVDFFASFLFIRHVCAKFRPVRYAMGIS